MGLTPGKRKPIGLAVILLVPAFLCFAVRQGVNAYAAACDRRAADRRHLLVCVPEMEGALREARNALRPFRGGAPGDAGNTEEFGLWLHDVGKRNGMELQRLAITKDADADAHTPALRATFAGEQELASFARAFHEFQDSPRVVLFDAVHLRLSDQSVRSLYVADVSLRAHVIAGANADTGSRDASQR